MERKLLTLKELCDYLGIGETKARELVRGQNGFGVQIGNRWYADKNKLDKWLDNRTFYYFKKNCKNREKTIYKAYVNML